MPLLLTNVTNSLVNVPCNGGEKHKYQNIVPGSTVEVSDDYVAELTPEATARFESVCQGPSPLFSVKVVRTQQTSRPERTRKAPPPEPKVPEKPKADQESSPETEA